MSCCPKIFQILRINQRANNCCVLNKGVKSQVDMAECVKLKSFLSSNVVVFLSFMNINKFFQSLNCHVQKHGDINWCFLKAYYKLSNWSNKFKTSSSYSIRYQTEQISVSPVRQHCVPEMTSSFLDCLVLPTDSSPVPHSFLRPSLLSCTAIE
jgi:hypothetical protein